LDRKKLVLFTILLSVSPSFLVFNNLTQRFNIINISVQTSDYEKENKIVISSVENYEDKIYSELDEYNIIQINHDYDNEKIVYNIQAKMKDVIYHITVVVSAVGGKLDGKNILDNEKRKRIYEFVNKHPGIHLREVMRSCNLSPNEAQYHLSTLERHNYIIQHKFGKYLLNFTYNFDYVKEEPFLFYLYTNNTLKRIFSLVSDNPALTIKEISGETGLHRNTVGKYFKVIKNYTDVFFKQEF